MTNCMSAAASAVQRRPKASIASAALMKRADR